MLRLFKQFPVLYEVVRGVGFGNSRLRSRRVSSWSSYASCYFLLVCHVVLDVLQSVFVLDLPYVSYSLGSNEYIKFGKFDN